MRLFEIQKVANQKVQIDNFGEVCRIERKVVLYGSRNKEKYSVTLVCDDALKSIQPGQLALADLRVESSHCCGQKYYNYYLLSFAPLEGGADIVYQKDLTSKLV